MTAKGKINASKVQAGDRIIVRVGFNTDLNRQTVQVSDTKTGEGVQVARVIGKTFRAAQGPYEARGKYIVETSTGSFESAAIQTMWLAPEDAAGIKRAMVEAQAEDEDRSYTAEERADESRWTLGTIDDMRDQAEAEESYRESERALAAQAEEHQATIKAMADRGEARTADPRQWAIEGTEYPYRGEVEPTEVIHLRREPDPIACGITGRVRITRVFREVTCQSCIEAATPTPVEFTVEEEADRAAAGETPIEADQRHQDEALAAPGFDPEAGASAPDANRHASQTGGDEELTLHSQGGKVDNMTETSTAQAETTPATSENYTGSTVVRMLERIWERIREDHVDLPEVVIITGSGLVGASKWGHFRADGWKIEEEGAAARKHELFLAGEALAKGATQVLQTMLHEGAHTLAQVRDIKDTSRQHRWHNAAFKKLAEEMGLEHKASQADSSHGYSFVTLTAETKDRYADLLTELDAEIKLTCHLPLWLGGTADQDEEKGGEKITGKPTKTGGSETKSGPLKAVCECEEPLIIRLSQKVLDLGVVRCDECESLFTAA